MTKDEIIAQLKDLAQTGHKALEADSNDAEFEALHEIVESIDEIVGGA